MHLHLVHTNVIGRREIIWDSGTRPGTPEFDGTLLDPPGNDGAYLVPQPTVQHFTALNGLYGQGFRLVCFSANFDDCIGAPVAQPPEYYEESDKDMVIALPGQVTTIRAKFDKPGRYVW
jgi:hypothetical protein